ncbi:hypothetical protein U9M48_004992, partial [Paspalum notatum var. saurae]
MFVIGTSYRALLEVVAARCSLEYAGFVSEVAEDGALLCGVELVLPASAGSGSRSTVFFWSPVKITCYAAYEQASLQAISYLQSIYAFLVVDYSFQGLVWYRGVARAAVSVGARAARFASFLCVRSGDVSLPAEEVLTHCRLADHGDENFVIRIVGAREGDPVQYNLPTTDQLAMLVVGDFTLDTFRRDIVIEARSGQLQRISALHPAYMALQYPLLFPYGERGFQVGVVYEDTVSASSNARSKMTPQDYYCCLFHYKPDQPNPYLFLHTVEFQKRGLPHAHIIIWLLQDTAHPTPDLIDKFISAEIPDPNEDPLGYALVAEHMMHGPCGSAFPRCPCMKKGKCSKRYPKPFQEATTLTEDGFALYKRPDNGRYLAWRLLYYRRCIHVTVTPSSVCVSAASGSSVLVELTMVTDDTLAIPELIYHLTPFADLERHAGVYSHFTDVIGVLVQVSDSKVVHLRGKPNPTITRDIVLRDLSYFEIKVSLWGHRAASFTIDTIYDPNESKPIVVLLANTISVQVLHVDGSSIHLYRKQKCSTTGLLLSLHRCDSSFGARGTLVVSLMCKMQQIKHTGRFTFAIALSDQSFKSSEKSYRVLSVLTAHGRQTSVPHSVITAGASGVQTQAIGSYQQHTALEGHILEASAETEVPKDSDKQEAATSPPQTISKMVELPTQPSHHTPGASNIQTTPSDCNRAAHSAKKGLTKNPTPKNIQPAARRKLSFSGDKAPMKTIASAPGAKKQRGQKTSTSTPDDDAIVADATSDTDLPYNVPEEGVPSFVAAASDRLMRLRLSSWNTTYVLWPMEWDTDALQILACKEMRIHPNICSENTEMDKGRPALSRRPKGPGGEEEPDPDRGLNLRRAEAAAREQEQPSDGVQDPARPRN